MGTTARFAMFAVLGGFVATGSLRAAVGPSEPLPTNAADFERLGQWDRAAEAYLRLLNEDRRQPEIRERLALCIRHLHQSRRHADVAFRLQLAALPLSKALSLYAEAMSALHDNYFDAGRASFERLFRNGLDEIRFALGDPTFRREYLGGVEPAAIAEFRDRLTNEWATKSIADLADARHAVRDLAWDAQRLLGLNPSVVTLEFAFGACHALDEFSVFLAPGQSLVDAASLGGGDLTAYGLTLSGRGDRLVIERVAPGSWAAAEGLMPGDRVTHVGRQSLERMPVDSALEVIRGERPVVTDLSVQSAGMTKLRTINLPAFVPSVLEAAMDRDGIGYMRIASFQKTTPPEFESAMLRLRSEGLQALVLDLRGNPGGSFPAAVQIAERFLPQGVIVSTHGQLRGLTKTFTAQNPPSLDMPLVLLVDGETASAAEVLTGALKDHARATLVGTPTFGKDSVQRLLRLNEGGAIRLTLARFLLPGGKPFAGVGVSPHVSEPRREPMRDHQFEAALEQAARMLAMR